MQVSGYRPRTLKDYDTILHNFTKSAGITYLEEVTVDTIYSWLGGESSLGIATERIMNLWHCLIEHNKSS